MFLSVAASLSVLCLVSGCSEQASAPKTQQEVKDFKGGPPPPEAQAKIREMMSKGGGPGKPAGTQ